MGMQLVHTHRVTVRRFTREAPAHGLLWETLPKPFLQLA